MTTDETIWPLLLKYTEQGDCGRLEEAMEKSSGMNWGEDGSGDTLLHVAARSGYKDVVKALLARGHPWTPLNQAGLTAAEEAQTDEIYKLILDEAIRSEMILNALNSAVASEEEEEEFSKEYLESDLEYADRRLVDSTGNAVMMSWEREVMRKHATIVCQMEDNGKEVDDELMDFDTAPDRLELLAELSPDESNNNDNDNNINDDEEFNVLNVGFGMGIVDTYIHQLLAMKQRKQPGLKCRHVIIEAHPQVVKRMQQLNWVSSSTTTDNIDTTTTTTTDSTSSTTDRPESTNLKFGKNGPELIVLVGRWQEAVPKLYEMGILFDGIFFDTFGEDYAALARWHDHCPNLMNIHQPSIYSFFNGLGGTNPFFHQVYCNVVEMDLADVGIGVDEWRTVEVDSDCDREQWSGVARNYYTLKTYRLPICRLLDI